MGLTDFFKNRAPAARADNHIEEELDRFIASRNKIDHLGNAAFAGDMATAAKNKGDLHAAWGLFQDMKEHYLQHAVRENFTPAQTLALDSAASPALADILRLEGKHRDALVHIAYWIACAPKPSKMQKQKLRAYFKRCEFTVAVLADVEKLVLVSRVRPDFVQIRDTIRGWNGQG